MEQAVNYDSEFCGSLPVQHINLIQPYGFLLVLEKETLAIIQISENVQELFALAPEQIVNTRFSNYITSDETRELIEKFRTGIQGNINFTFTLHLGEQKKELVGSVHSKEEYLIMELEYSPENTPSFMDVFREVKYMMSAIDHQHTLENICNVTVRELKRLTGYDSILMYRFDEDWNGTVIAQASEKGMPDYLGLKFPASDIPKQVRNLYMRNPYRLIPARTYTPVKLYPVINPLTHTLTDLSDCNLRSVANVHIEYMKNMGLEASMSLRIMNNTRLWGLISCHHRTPRHLGFELRSVLELLSNVVSNKIAAALAIEEFKEMNKLIEKRTKLIDYIYAEKNWVKSVLQHKVNLLHLLDVDGVAIIYKGKTETLGTVPDKDDIENLVYWMQAKNISKVYAVTNLSSVNDHALNYTTNGSGIIAVPINTETGDFIIGFRKEVVRTVNWGGNPDEAITFETDKKNYHPRNSFRVWKQEVKNTSRPWSNAELKIAESFRSYVYEYIIRKTAVAI